MHQIKDLFLKIRQILEKADVLDFQISAEEILAFFLKVKRNELFFLFDKPLPAKLEKQVLQAVDRRAKKEPLQYILGSVLFYNVNLKVSSAALIPRPETELLVDLVVQRLKFLDLKGKTLFDLCTGSGAIAIALKKSFPNLRVVASDISPKALALARENAFLNGVDIEFKEGSLFTPYQKKSLNGGVERELADFIVSNPPYVSLREYQNLALELFYEPKEAFLGGGDGLFFYKKIAEDVNLFLKKEGRLFLEMGDGQKKALEKLFSDRKNFSCSGIKEKNIKTMVLPDLTGKERFFFIEFQ